MASVIGIEYKLNVSLAGHIVNPIGSYLVLMDHYLVSAAQIRAARALLRWTQEELAEKADVTVPTLKRWEASDGVPTGSAKKLAQVRRALEAGGVQFIDENGGGAGVRMKQPK